MMNFLLRSTHHVAPDLPTVPEDEPHKDGQHTMLKSATTLEGLIAEDPFPKSSGEEDGGGGDSDATGDASAAPADLNLEKQLPMANNHSDVAEDEGWITIPQGIYLYPDDCLCFLIPFRHKLLLV